MQSLKCFLLTIWDALQKQCCVVCKHLEESILLFLCKIWTWFPKHLLQTYIQIWCKMASLPNYPFHYECFSFLSIHHHWCLNLVVQWCNPANPLIWETMFSHVLFKKCPIDFIIFFSKCKRSMTKSSSLSLAHSIAPKAINTLSKIHLPSKKHVCLGFIHEDKKGWNLLAKVSEVILYVNLRPILVCN